MKENLVVELNTYIDDLWDKGIRVVEDIEQIDLLHIIIMLIRSTPSRYLPCVNRIDPENELLNRVADLLEVPPANANDPILFYSLVDVLLVKIEDYYKIQISQLLKEKAIQSNKKEEYDIADGNIELQRTIHVDNKQRI